MGPSGSATSSDLSKLAPPSELRLAIERPSGLIVDTLVEAKFAVVPIHRLSAAGPEHRAR
jgi:hypothetical protein